MYDALQKDSGWEGLDDSVYITRVIIRVTEFLVSILIVWSGKLIFFVIPFYLQSVPVHPANCV
jgi:hypothetical protein